MSESEKMAIYDLNLRLWGKVCPYGVELLNALDPSQRSERQKISDTEAKAWFKDLALADEQVIYVFGVGRGEYYLAAKEWLRLSPTHYLIFIEPNIQLIKELLETDVGSQIIRDRHVALFPIEQNKNPFNTFFQIVQRYALRSFLVTTQPEYQAFGLQIQQTIAYLADMIGPSHGEVLTAEGQAVILSNFLSNYLDLPRSHAAQELKGQFKGVPAIICGAGPSLDKNIHLLSELQDRALIFAGGTAMNALNGKGIYPHFGAGIDPNAAQFTRLVMNQGYEVPFFYKARMHHESLELVHGERLFVFGSGVYALYDYLDQELGIPSYDPVSEGRNVLNFAVSLAHYLGCNPIICVGIDLAYTDGMSYASCIANHPIHPRRENFITRYEEENLMWTTDIAGQPVHTLSKWISESFWYGEFKQTNPDIRLINATEGGIGFPGVDNIPLASLKDLVLKKTFDIPSMIHGAIQNSQLIGSIASEDQIIHLLNLVSSSIQKCLDSLHKIIKKLEVDKRIEAVSQEIEALHQQIAYQVMLKNGEETLKTIDQHRQDYLKIAEELLPENEVRVQRVQILLDQFRMLYEIARNSRDVIDMEVGLFIENRSLIAPEAEALKAKLIGANPLPIPNPSDTYSFDGKELIIKDVELNIDLHDTYETEEERNSYHDGKIKMLSYRKKGSLHGPSTYYDKEGHILTQMWYWEGKSVGKVWSYYKGGALHSLKRYKGGVPHGQHLYFYQDGLPRSVIGYKEGQLDGEILLYHPSGQLAHRIFFSNGNRKGHEEIWNEKGTLLVEAEYKDNHPVGVARWYYETGRPYKQFVYDELGMTLSGRQWDKAGKESAINSEKPKGYFEHVAEQIQVLTGALNSVIEELTGQANAVELKVKKNTFSKDLTTLYHQQALLKELSDKINNMEKDLEDPTLTKEALWKSPEVKREMQRNLTKFKEEIAREFEEIAQGMQDIMNKGASVVRKDGDEKGQH